MAKETLSPENAAIVERFTTLITHCGDALTLRKAFTKLYIQYTRLLTITSEDDFVRERDETETCLYYLSQLISLLETEQTPFPF